MASAGRRQPMPQDDRNISSRLAAVEAAISQLARNDERLETQVGHLVNRQEQQMQEIMEAIHRVEMGQQRNSDQINRWRGAFGMGTFIWRGLVAVVLLILGWLLSQFQGKL